jgi:hypothetical protein
MEFSGFNVKDFVPKDLMPTDIRQKIHEHMRYLLLQMVIRLLFVIRTWMKRSTRWLWLVAT